MALFGNKHTLNDFSTDKEYMNNLYDKEIKKNKFYIYQSNNTSRKFIVQAESKLQAKRKILKHNEKAEDLDLIEYYEGNNFFYIDNNNYYL